MPLGDQLHPVRQRAIGFERAIEHFVGDAERARRRDRCRDVLRVVRSLQRRPARLVRHVGGRNQEALVGDLRGDLLAMRVIDRDHRGMLGRLEIEQARL